MVAKFKEMSEDMQKLKKIYYEQVRKDKNKNKNMPARHQYGYNNSKG
ncbi:MAG: hypothetical protein ACJ71H_19340 [Nitrososphaeraceae archaeon]